MGSHFSQSTIIICFMISFQIFMNFLYLLQRITAECFLKGYLWGGFVEYGVFSHQVYSYLHSIWRQNTNAFQLIPWNWRGQTDEAGASTAGHHSFPSRWGRSLESANVLPGFSLSCWSCAVAYLMFSVFGTSVFWSKLMRRYFINKLRLLAEYYKPNNRWSLA